MIASSMKDAFQAAIVLIFVTRVPRIGSSVAVLPIATSIFVTLLTTSIVNATTCEDLFVPQTEGSFFYNSSFKILEAPSTPFSNASVFNAGKSRLPELLITVDRNEGFGQLANYLKKRGVLDVTETYVRSIASRSSDGFVVPLSKLLPESIRNLTNRVSGNCRANCYGATVRWEDGSLTSTENGFYADPAQFWRFTGGKVDSEYGLHFTGKQLISEQNSARFGDILIIGVVDSSGQLVKLHHAARFINADYLWHKPSKDEHDPWTFERVSDVLNYYAAKSPRMWSSPKYELGVYVVSRDPGSIRSRLKRILLQKDAVPSSFQSAPVERRAQGY
jgi:hypothetical protein